MINRTIRNFQIKELIATGGMAAIYKAIQVSLDRVVAIKILHGHLAQDSNFITRFEREAKAAANLKHENIVNIIDYGQAEDVYFIAMEYIDGRSLKELMAAVKFMPPDIALAIAHKIGRGLNNAHQKGMVHRDIKPANILISYDGNVKIADFGLAQAQDLTSVTITGSIVGTPAYMSPEQAAGKKVDKRTDIFSLGVVIYEMITGSKPFCGENYSSVIHEIITVKPARPLEANPLIDREVNDLIEKMLEKDLDNRYQDIGEINDAINSYFKNRKIDITQKQIGDFVSKPDELFQGILEKRKEKHFERGLYFMNLGYEKIDDAISEFNKVLHLEPHDERAKKYIGELMKKKAAKPPFKKIVSDEKKKKKARPLIPIFIIAGCFAIIALVYGFLHGRRSITTAPEDSFVSFGCLDIRSIPDKAAVCIDDNDQQLMTPALLNSLSIGEHTLVLTKPGYLDYTEHITLEKGDTLVLKPVLIKEEESVSTGSIVVRSQPTGANIYLDGSNTGLKTPCTLTDISVGKHYVKLVMKSYAQETVSRDIAAGKESSINITLTKIETAPRPEKSVSYLKINVIPWAKIYIDGKYIETTPIAQPIEVISGMHTLRLENPNFKVWQQKITLTPGKTTNLDIKLQTVDGLLRLTVKPWADVYIDGRYFETTPIAKPIKLSSGKHHLKLINPSYKTVEEQIDIPPGKMLKKYIELQPK
jgi:serine/threonine protein kinase